MTAPQISYQPQGICLKRFHESDAYCRCVIGPLGSGKTHAMLMELLFQMLNQEPDRQKVRHSRIAIVRNSWPDLKNTVIADFNEIIGATGLGQLKLTAPAEWVAEFPVGDGTTVKAEILFLAFDDASDERKARGLQLSGVWFNEAAELNKANIDILMARVGRHPKKVAVPNARQFVIMDTNACARDHWLANEALDNKPDNWEFFIQAGAVNKVDGKWKVYPMAENLSNLPDHYYSNLMVAKSDQWIRRNLANEFVYLADGRPVHPDFSEATHAREVSLDPALPLFVGMDFGRTPAAVFGQKLSDGRWIITHELVTENMGALRFGEMLQRFIAENEDLQNCLSYSFTGDPAGEHMAQTRDETVFEVLDSVGIRAQPAHTNDFAVRTNTLDKLLSQLIGGEPAFLVHPRCKALVRGLAGGYHFRRMKVPGDERYDDKPNKNMHSHVCEACHYLLMGAGEDLVALAGDFMRVYDEVTTEPNGWGFPDSYFE